MRRKSCAVGMRNAILRNPLKARFVRRNSTVSNSVQRIKFGRNSTSESAAVFLPHFRLVLSYYFKENDNNSKFIKHVSTETSVIFSRLQYKALQVEFISRKKMLIMLVTTECTKNVTK